MPTIVTVHGTFASGPEEGEKWWQRGSPFQHELSRRVAAADGGPVHIDPFIWDGQNSETSRRAAGRGLFHRLAQLTAQGEPTVVVGHSHGGSVIGAALIEAAKHGATLSSLRAWFTIGTPFIESVPQRLLFLRLGFLGKSAYVAMFTYLLLGVLMLWQTGAEMEGPELLIGIVSVVTPFLLAHGLLQYFERNRLHLYRKPTRQFAVDTFGERWRSFMHPNDEALAGLKAVRDLDLAVFPSSLVVAPLSLLSVVLLPALCLALLFSPSLMTSLADVFFAAVFPPNDIADGRAGLFASEGHSLGENAFLLVVSAAALPIAQFVQPEFFRDTPVWATVLLFASASLLFMGAGMAMTLLVSGSARVISAGLVRILNPATNAQLRRSAYGSDTLEDRAVDVNARPMWLGVGRPFLPASVAVPIEATSNTAISETVPKFRAAVGRLGAAKNESDRLDLLSEYLTWNELIHTSYFRDVRFADLVAYALAQQDGFAATPGFASSEAFAEAGRAYHALTVPQPGSPA